MPFTYSSTAFYCDWCKMLIWHPQHKCQRETSPIEVKKIKTGTNLGVYRSVNEKFCNFFSMFPTQGWLLQTPKAWAKSSGYFLHGNSIWRHHFEISRSGGNNCSVCLCIGSIGSLSNRSKLGNNLLSSVGCLLLRYCTVHTIFSQLCTVMVILTECHFTLIKLYIKSNLLLTHTPQLCHNGRNLQTFPYMLQHENGA